MTGRLYLLGMGPGQPEHVTAGQRAVVAETTRLYASERLQALLAELLPAAALAAKSLHPLDGHLAEALAALRVDLAAGENVAVLCTGDTQVFSLARYLRQKLADLDPELTVLPGISSAQLLAARLNLHLPETPLCSVHGRRLAAFREHLARLAPGSGLICFTDGQSDLRVLAEDCARWQVPVARFVLAERLGYPDECLTTLTADEALSFERPIDPLNLVYVERGVSAPRPLGAFPDAAFRRGPRPMSKHALRAQVLSALALPERAILWDIGAGTGAVSCDLAARSPAYTVYAIERELDDLWLIEANREQLSLPNIEIVGGSAPEALEPLPDPDAVFIGGSGKALPAILDLLAARCRAGGKQPTVLISTVTLESALEVQREAKRLGLSLSGTQIQAAHTQPLGPYTMWKGENPICLWSLDFATLAPLDEAPAAALDGAPKQSLKGTYYALGVGPGSPDDVTMGVWKRLQILTVVAYPQSAPGRPSVALEAVQPYLRPEQELLCIDFPMQRSAETREAIIAEALGKLKTKLDQGLDVGFVTIGDPCIYSTAHTLGERLAAEGYVVVYEAGLSALTAGFAAAGVAMGEGRERVAIIPADLDSAVVRDYFEHFDVLIVMKAAKVLADLHALAAERGILGFSYVIQNLGTREEQVYALADYPARAQAREPYLTTVLLRKEA